MNSIISAIGTSNPVNKFRQDRILQFMIDAHELDEHNSRRLEKLYHVSGIDYRHSVIDDFGKDRGQYEFFGNEDGLMPFPTTSKRSDLYESTALNLCLRAVDSCLGSILFNAQDITHLITVSCTGMYAPGLDIEIVESLRLNPHVERTCINFMGCYGAFNALKVADYICRAQPDAKVLIVDVELCTLHFQKENTLDNWLANSLFADGASAVLVQHEDATDVQLFKIKSFYTEVITKARKEMAWKIGDFGYEMQLTNQVAKQIKSGIRDVADKLLKKANIAFDDISQFAIHPGGRRILEVCDEVFSLNAEQNAHAYKVLRDFGNMSSTTVLFVLDELSRKLKAEKREQQVLSFAFGPGLTFESMVLSYA
ncbi:putative naringenin-chalcone synthase [Arcticibacter pallidicorallinus]|uniref:Putative naringenin-chalcone synthase n=1 Tax=Arcticibacter pallidicorallinus TaxID=1259464 RepID=A0A2T0U575_9SPHI|nr:type III polyketide synthase [Arcticibacter pallidicorallinus]PRY53076.1 putative naringenin-chalcone synthase [Arcticibacter pallidicorallinus]